MHRLFVALRPPERVREQLLDMMEGIGSLRWQDDEQLHLTLRFIGEVERPMAEDLAQHLQNIRSERFTLALHGLGRFDHRRGGVLWAGVAPSEPVKALAAKIERVCQSVGLEPEHRAFHPHITVARWSGPMPQLDPLIERNAALRSEPFEVDRFILYESHLNRDGASYEPIADYPLLTVNKSGTLASC